MIRIDDFSITNLRMLNADKMNCDLLQANGISIGSNNNSIPKRLATAYVGRVIKPPEANGVIISASYGDAKIGAVSVPVGFSVDEKRSGTVAPYTPVSIRSTGVDACGRSSIEWVSTSEITDISLTLLIAWADTIISSVNATNGQVTYLRSTGTLVITNKRLSYTLF